MAHVDFIDYIREKKLNKKDELWKQGDFLVLYDKNEKPIGVEGYGSYKNSIGKLKDDQIISQEPLYNDDDLGEVLDGVRMKMFFRIASQFFTDLIDQKQNNENCSYVTNADSLLADGYVPSKFSALISEQYGDSFKGIAEELSCRILNFYGSPTAYYKTIYDRVKKGVDYKINPLTVSIDFLQTGEDLMSVGNYMFYYTKKHLFDYEFTTIRSILEGCDFVFKNHQAMVEGKSLSPNLVKRRKGLSNGEKDEIAYAMLLRKYCLGDSDFHSGNIGLIINEEAKKIKLAPAYDFEFCFEKLPNAELRKSVLNAYKNGENIHDVIIEEQYIHGQNLRNMLEDLMFLKKEHPSVLEKFIGKTEEFLKAQSDDASNLDELLETTFENPPILKHNEEFYWDNEVALPISDEEKAHIKSEIKDNFLFMKLISEDVMQNENFEYLENFEAIK